MEPQDLIGPPSPLGYPAPFWFIEFFKVLGFTLHAVPMNLWYAGLLTALVLSRWGGAHERRMARRLISQMPVIVAAGVNLGIVPLLFTQVAYHQVFYPATILMAWSWLSIIALLTFAYYGIYCYVSAMKKNPDGMPFSREIVGWLSAGCFLLIGFTFTNGFSLAANIEGWRAIWERTSLAGAPLGTGLNTGDPSLWPRWLMMLGLALTTTAAYMVVDAGVFGRKEGEGYRRAAAGTAIKAYTAGMVWFALTGSWYAFGTWGPEVREALFAPPFIVVTALTAVSPGLPWLLIFTQREKVTRRSAALVGVAQFGVLGLNAVSRQIKQNVEIGRYLDVSAGRMNPQWSPMVLFLLLFVAGIGVLLWMVGKVVEESAERTE